MSKKKETVALRDALDKIQYATMEEADIALNIFEHWIAEKTDQIWARDFAALARVEWPMAFYNYGWSNETLLNALFNGDIYTCTGSLRNSWSINVPDPVAITEEDKEKEENK